MGSFCKMGSLFIENGFKFNDRCNALYKFLHRFLKQMDVFDNLFYGIVQTNYFLQNRMQK